MSEEFEKVFVGGVPFTVASTSRASSTIITDAMLKRSKSFHLWNTYSVGLNAYDPSVRIKPNVGTVFLADGKPISALMALSSRRLTLSSLQVRGSDLFRDVMQNSQGLPVRHSFYGSTPKTLDHLATKLAADYPAALSVDFFAPAFGPVNDDLIQTLLSRIREHRPAIVWLGFGTPKQDQIAVRLTEQADVVVICVGAAFDFLAGIKPESPRWAVTLGLEWFYRLSTEPKRLWRRYTFGTTWFLLSLTGWKRSSQK